MEQLREFTFWEHVEELRKRVFYSAVAVALSGTLVFVKARRVMDVLLQPFKESFQDATLVGLSPGEAFNIRILLSIWLGVIISSPMLLYQAWRFVEPGLYSKEKKVLKGIFLYASALFLLGVAFAYFVMLPYALSFFITQYETMQVTPTIRLGDYLTMLIKVTLASGFVFLLPVITYVGTLLGVITSQFLLENIRLSIVIIFVISAIITPPDVLTQLILAGPLILLYFVSILTARVGEKQ